MRQGYILSIIAFALLIMPVCNDASAADDQMITLSCDGRITAGSGRTEQVSKIGVVVNLAEQTVAFGGHVVEISRVDAANVSFAPLCLLLGRNTDHRLHRWERGSRYRCASGNAIVTWSQSLVRSGL